MESSRGGDRPARRDSCKAAAEVQGGTGEKRAAFGEADGGTSTRPGLGWPLAPRQSLSPSSACFCGSREFQKRPGTRDSGTSPGIRCGRRGLPLLSSPSLQLAQHDAPQEQNRAHQSLLAFVFASRPGRLGKLFPEACSLAPSLEVHRLTSH